LAKKVTKKPEVLSLSGGKFCGLTMLSVLVLIIGSVPVLIIRSVPVFVLFLSINCAVIPRDSRT